MKSLTYAFLMLISVTAFAQQSNFEIPVSDKDFTPPQQQWDHFRTQVKEISCKGRQYGVLYKSFWGWSQGSKLLGVCAWENRATIEGCQADENPDTIFCYNKVVEYYRLEAKHPKVPLPNRAPIADIELPPEASR